MFPQLPQDIVILLFSFHYTREYPLGSCHFLILEKKGKKRAHFTRFPDKSTTPTLSTNLSIGRAKIAGNKTDPSRNNLFKNVSMFIRVAIGGSGDRNRSRPGNTHPVNHAGDSLARCRATSRLMNEYSLHEGESDFLDRIFRVSTSARGRSSRMK